jgi:hypothetical protein
MTNTKLDNPLAAFLFLGGLPVDRYGWGKDVPASPVFERVVADLLDLGWIAKKQGAPRFRLTEVGRDALEAAQCSASAELEYRSTWRPVSS